MRRMSTPSSQRCCFGYLLQRPAQYVLKRELRWFPSFDLFGPPLGNYFVNRNGNTDSELDHLRGLLGSSTR